MIGAVRGAALACAALAALPAFAQGAPRCTREDLQKVADGYVAAVAAGDSTKLPMNLWMRYSENGDDSTAMTFDRQEREALVATLGWQLVGNWQAGSTMLHPYAQLAWNHDSKAEVTLVDQKWGLPSQKKTKPRHTVDRISLTFSFMLFSKIFFNPHSHHLLILTTTFSLSGALILVQND